MSKRILFVIKNLGGGGAERQLIHLLNHLDRNLYLPALALFQKTGCYLHHVPADVPVYELSQRQGTSILWKLMERAEAILRLRQLIQGEKPNVICTFLWDADVLGLMAALTLRPCCPVIVCQQSDPSYNLSKIKLSLPALLFNRWIYQKASGIIACSKGISRQMSSLFKVTNEKIYVVYNGIDTNGVIAASRKKVQHSWLENDDIPLILAMGRLVPDKGFTDLIKAFAILRRKRPLRLLILGEGPQRQQLEELTVNLSLQDTVELVGFQPNPFPYLAQASVFVCSSLSEAFGNVLLEAMALGVPVVATKCDGPADIIEDGRTGLLAPAGCPMALADAVEKILNDPELGWWLGFNARAVARERFSIKVAARSFSSVVDSILVNSGSGGGTNMWDG